MILGEKFKIKVQRWEDSRWFKMNVECIYVSDQVLRFKVTGGNKEIVMEKQLIKKTSKWKIKEMNFKFEGDDKTIAMAIMNIQNEIEHQIKPPLKKNWNK